MSTRNRRTSPAMVEAWTMPVLVQLLAAAEALRSALVQLGGLEPPTSCSTGRIFAPTRLRHPRRCYENDSIIND
jgi:hypothetical protein